MGAATAAEPSHNLKTGYNLDLKKKEASRCHLAFHCDFYETYIGAERERALLRFGRLPIQEKQQVKTRREASRLHNGWFPMSYLVVTTTKLIVPVSRLYLLTQLWLQGKRKARKARVLAVNKNLNKSHRAVV